MSAPGAVAAAESGTRTPGSGFQGPRRDTLHHLPPHLPRSPAQGPALTHARRLLLLAAPWGPPSARRKHVSEFAPPHSNADAALVPAVYLSRPHRPHTSTQRMPQRLSLSTRPPRGRDAAWRAGPGLRGAARGASSRTPSSSHCRRAEVVGDASQARAVCAGRSAPPGTRPQQCPQAPPASKGAAGPQGPKERACPLTQRHRPISQQASRG